MRWCPTVWAFSSCCCFFVMLFTAAFCSNTLHATSSPRGDEAQSSPVAAWQIISEVERGHGRPPTSSPCTNNWYWPLTPFLFACELPLPFPLLLYVNLRIIFKCKISKFKLHFFLLLLLPFCSNEPILRFGWVGGEEEKEGLETGGREEGSREEKRGGERRGALGSSASQIRVLGEKSTIHDSLHVSCWASEMARTLAKKKERKKGILATVGTLGSLSEALMPDQNWANEKGLFFLT